MWQKNNKHNQKRFYFQNNKKQFLCPVQAWIQIVRRGLKYIKDPKKTPLAIYRTPSLQTKMITANLAADQIRQLIGKGNIQYLQKRRYC